MEQYWRVVRHAVCFASGGCQGVRVWTAVSVKLKPPGPTAPTVKGKVLCSSRNNTAGHLDKKRPGRVNVEPHLLELKQKKTRKLP